MDFQHRVAAFFAVRVLAETEAPSLWGLPAGATFESIRCETDHPVDDLMVVTSADGLVFGQVKRSVTLSSKASSELAGILDQFVRQVHAGRSDSGAALDPERDRLAGC
jgi:hypothetical protein